LFVEMRLGWLEAAGLWNPQPRRQTTDPEPGLRPSSLWLSAAFASSLEELIGPPLGTPANNSKPAKDNTIMTFLHHPPARCLGIDVAKDTLVAGDGCHAPTSVANTRKSIRSLLAKACPDFVICEPTGGYELVLLEECLRAGIACHRANTRNLKSFIHSYGQLGKSDAIDAAAMAAYGRERWARLALWQAPAEDDKHLQALVRRRADLIAFRTAEKNRSKAPMTRGAKAIAASFKAVLAMLERQIEAIDDAIAALVAKSHALKRRIAVCTTVSGVGLISAITLLAQMPELGSLQRRQAAALAGTAPHPNESGASRGYRRQRGGRPQVKIALFMPAMHAAQSRGQFATFYKRLRDNGKRPIVAIAAVMRKIVVTLNARLRDAQSQQS
jgi:transposase